MWFRRMPRVEPLSEPDFGPELERLHNGLAVLLRDGEPVGHVASSLGYFTTRGGRQPWVWLVVVWSDGTKERSVEDYAPWTYVADMRAGYFDFDEPYGSGRGRGRKHSRAGRYEIEWLPRDRALAERERLGVSLKDF